MTAEAERAGAPIAPVFGAHYDSDRQMLVIEMAYAGKQSLEKILRARAKNEEPMNGEEYISWLQLLCQVCDALSFAHNYENEVNGPDGVLHLDVKPGNVVLESEDGGSAKLIDFDTARLATGEEGQSMSVAVSLGTGDYVHPSVQADPGKASVKTDLYSVGLTAKKIFCGDPKAAQQPSQVVPAASAILDAIVATAVDDENFSSARDMKGALEFAIRAEKGNLGNRLVPALRIGVSLVYFLYLASLLFGPGSFGNADLHVLIPAVVALGFSSLSMYWCLRYRTLGIDVLLKDARVVNVLLTTLLMASWIIDIVLIRLFPEHFFLFIATALFLTLLRTLAYRRTLKNMPQIWGQVWNLIPMMFLGTLLALAGHIILPFVEQPHRAYFSVAGTVFLLFHVVVIRKRLWERVLAEAYRRRGWQGLP